jgi:cytosine/adenosine deaminase-related metal-dependent hydrolase
LQLDVSHWKPGDKNPLLSVLKHLPVENPLLLVHNTLLEKSVIDELKKQRSATNTFFVLCPNSNLFIENKMPPVSLLKKEGLIICLGTDSLASNHELSLLSEMKTIQNSFPEITLEELIMWGCSNGAKAIQAEKKLGSFEAGKQPGINLISGIDFKQMKFTPASRVERLI